MDLIKPDKRDYELSFLVVDKGSETAVGETLNRHGAEVFYQSPVTQIQLAYPVKKNKQAYFGFLQFRSLPEAIEKVAKTLQLDKTVLRFLVITPPIRKREERALKSRSGFRQQRERAPEAVSPSVSSNRALTNEALEEKLEEILK
ncbi:MAG: hypothetical protein A3I89_00635 [Candidatus Harrisonbacteria bacterium RIFCSPLOWO2_02_FULL_41_11]|uniref:Small ribosomal subunit protein bS6 n=1 Tax=Candidatus Harrisonbacteria bacterium RIFCSPHIGHO2_02_FULL_42_16 TaxID=1798404 RepID=A0A1G1ZJ28_9BACT|nr:MAG: hypothetical protein A3B92_02440 [Candidatus Harrisonbacteria bacterium RIFCSPHIGHO2_02_FULL_42_16]OGY66502.1 MAG: hypothetical protein A3I89_00635 [Candidatus Harrisonbacteria bacterium RIFCSPLOWO2_02_FULL_41_11]